MSKIRVLVADDHAVLRAGLKLLINTQPDLEVVGEASDHRQALQQALALKPDVLSLDMSMPAGNAIQVIQTLARECPQVRVLVLTMHDDPAYFRMALASGAVGYVCKKAADSELLTAIRQVARGKVYTQLELSSDGLSRKSPAGAGAARSPLEELSERELEVLQFLAQGFTNQAIADHLVLSVKTVESYRARLMSKLQMRSRAELTQFALESGLLLPPQDTE
jgi:two-component system response regulator NreC